MAISLIVIALDFGIHAPAQRIAAVNSARINATAGGGTIARTLGGQSSGRASFAVSEGNAKVVSGKVAGYGKQPALGNLGEYASQPGRSSFSSSLDFPDTDFVATMPRPSLYGSPAPPSSLPGSSFGITLSSVSSARGSSAFPAHSTHRGAATLPQPGIRNPDAILNPFTHPISSGLGGSLATGLGSHQ